MFVRHPPIIGWIEACKPDAKQMHPQDRTLCALTFFLKNVLIRIKFLNLGQSIIFEENHKIITDIAIPKQVLILG